MLSSTLGDTASATGPYVSDAVMTARSQGITALEVEALVAAFAYQELYTALKTLQRPVGSLPHASTSPQPGDHAQAVVTGPAICTNTVQWISDRVAQEFETVCEGP